MQFKRAAVMKGQWTKQTPDNANPNRTKTLCMVTRSKPLKNNNRETTKDRRRQANTPLQPMEAIHHTRPLNLLFTVFVEVVTTPEI
jgi:hypothetical protein